MAGQFTVQGANSYYTYYDTSSNSRTVAQLVRFNVACRIVSMHYWHSTNVGFSINASIWDNTLAHGSSRLGGQFLSNATAPAGNWYEIVFSTPVTLLANKDYMFGWFAANSSTPSTYLPTSYPFSGAVASSPAGVTATFGQQYMNNYVSEAYHPLSTSYDVPFMKIGIDTNYLPNAPTGVSVTAPVVLGGNPTMTWIHNDPDSNPQSKYQLRWRKI